MIRDVTSSWSRGMRTCSGKSEAVRFPEQKRARVLERSMSYAVSARLDNQCLRRKGVPQTAADSGAVGADLQPREARPDGAASTQPVPRPSACLIRSEEHTSE